MLASSSFFPGKRRRTSKNRFGEVLCSLQSPDTCRLLIPTAQLTTLRSNQPELDNSATACHTGCTWSPPARDSQALRREAWTATRSLGRSWASDRHFLAAASHL